ncbi:MAG: hypothetical protein K2K80_03380 [Clostridia bacterium]|nr:hypothetical protein [Clostridia bacterium]
MRKVLNFVNDNKKIIIVVILIIVLVGTIYFINKSQKNDVPTVSSTAKSATEIKLTNILSAIDGVGSTDVMINEGEEGILGVVIVCDGANNIMTKSDILNAVSTALNVDKNLIAIYSKK